MDYNPSAKSILGFVALAGAFLYSGAGMTYGADKGGAAPTGQTTAQAGQYYCPPGAKFCPVPGRDNTTFLDTHFGMDATTGQVTAYKGTVHPDEVQNNQTTTEQLLYQPTGLSATPNGYLDPSRAGAAITPEQAMAARNGNSRPATAPIRSSEVANQQSARPSAAKPIAEDSKVPWWKGGMWRNKKDPTDESPPPPPKQTNQAAASPKPISSDDMWGQDSDYSGYNSDGSFNNNLAPGAMNQDPFAAPPQSYSQAPQQTYIINQPQQPMGSGGFVTDAYTLPNSPGPSSPYPAGYVYPGTAITYESANPGYQAQPATYPTTTTYAPPPPPTYQQPVAQPMTYAPPAAPVPAISSQFETAVQMVKEGRFAEAKPIFLGETAQNPANALAWRWLGDCQYNLLELQAAIDSYNRALAIDPNDYYALRGQGFSYLHHGHELWRQMMDELRLGGDSAKAQAAATFSQAHDNYKRSLEVLAQCLQKAPNDSEAIYGEAMAAEGASRKLYSNAVSYLKLGPENRQRAELFAENCLQVINKGIERSVDRATQNPGESGPRALLGGLYLRKAMLYNQMGKNDLALAELKNSYRAQRSILDEIDKNNPTALKGVADCESYWRSWGGQGAI